MKFRACFQQKHNFGSTSKDDPKASNLLHNTKAIDILPKSIPKHLKKK